MGLDLRIFLALMVVGSVTAQREVCQNVQSCCTINAEKLGLTCSDITNVDWLRLSGLRLRKISIKNAENGLSEFASSLPKLDTVTDLTIANCTDVQLPSIDKLPRLDTLSIKENALNDREVDALLNKWAGSNVSTVKLYNNDLTAYPAALNRLPMLKSVVLSGNRIASLNVTMSFTVPVNFIDLSSNTIELIHCASMFKGNFINATINLQENLLDKHDSNARVLRNLASRVREINIGDVNCTSCFMSAFVRDEPRLIKENRITGSCSDDGEFKALKAENYPVKTCPKSSSPALTVAYTLPVFAVALLYFL